MVEATVQRQKDQTDKRSSLLSIILFLLFLVALVLPIFSYQIPPPKEEGVLISFGQPEEGARAQQAETQNRNPEQQTSQDNQSDKIKSDEVKKSKVKPTAAAPPSQNKLVSKIEKDVIVPKSTQQATTVSAEQLRLQAEADKRKKEIEAQAAAAKAAAERQAKFEESKKQFSNLLTSGVKGKEAESGNTGSPDGDQKSDALAGVSTGTGRIGGGLANRGVLFEPEVKDDSQKTGKIVMKVCVDAQGKVTEATFTQRGSTTVDGELRQKAKRAANKYKFDSADIEEQCGTITFDFKVE